ncbi:MULTISPECIES: hypothetical protein [unclassified Haladaptatus]|uniref:hypothetical protein n=1 Tax=unclassified Haladaptatus TaxID=2622732 RepID=UPI0023E7A7E8|nr:MULTISPECIES: hypothetical protein [unclassified Haladaptatus]
MAYGPDAIIELIDEAGWTYPVTVRRLESEYSLANVQVDAKGNSIMLAELFLDADVDRFESEADLRRKLEPIFKAESKSREKSLVGRLKQTFFGGN